MGAEAGQALEAILWRKELERLSNNGLFAWGVGNSIAPAMRHARELGFESLDVLFTRMKSAPKRVDAAPSELVLWTAYEGERGAVVPLPLHLVVTSRGRTPGRSVRKSAHYALLCRSELSLLAHSDEQAVDSSGVCNLVSQKRPGASQVTAIVRTCASHESGRRYDVQFRAKLASPGFVRLLQPTLLTGDLLNLYRHALDAANPNEWRVRSEALRRAARSPCVPSAGQGDFFADCVNESL